MLHRFVHRPHVLRFLALFLILAGLCVPVASAQSAQLPGPYVIDIGPKATVEVPVYGFCLDPERPFPEGQLKLYGLAADPIRVATAYALSKGYTETEPFQVQLALWYFAGGNERVPGEEYGPVAEEIIAFVEANPTPPDANASATALHNAVTAGYAQEQLADFVKSGPAEEPGFYGTGTLRITSLVDFPQQILVPWGLEYHDPQATEVQPVVIFPRELPKPRPTPTPPTIPPSLPPTGQLLPTPVIVGGLVLAGSAVAFQLRRRTRA